MANLGLLLVVLLFVLIALRVPIYIALGFPTMIYFLLEGNLFVVAQTMIRTLDTFSLIAVPLFIFVGSLLNHSGIADKIFDFANSLLGPIAGGLAYVNIFSSMVFSGMSGSAIADIGGMGRVVMGQMERQNYSNSYTAALTSSSATIGPLFPPSIPLIVFGVIAGRSVVQLLLAGAVPALLLFVMFLAVTAILARTRGFPSARESFEVRTIGKTFLIALPAMGAPIVLIGGLMTGRFGVTPIAAVTVLYLVLINIIFYQNWDVMYFWESAVEASDTTARVLIMVASAGVFASVITLEGTNQLLADALFAFSTDPIVLLLAVNVLLIILGLFMEPLSAMLIMIPIVVPTLTTAGVDPIQIGVIMVFNLMIGLLTPPFGLSLFLASDIAGADYVATVRDLAPYYVALLIVLLFVTLVPEVSLWVPRTFA